MKISGVPALAIRSGMRTTFAGIQRRGIAGKFLVLVAAAACVLYVLNFRKICTLLGGAEIGAAVLTAAILLGARFVSAPMRRTAYRRFLAGSTVRTAAVQALFGFCSRLPLLACIVLAVLPVLAGVSWIVRGVFVSLFMVSAALGTVVPYMRYRPPGQAPPDDRRVDGRRGTRPSALRARRRAGIRFRSAMLWSFGRPWFWVLVIGLTASYLWTPAAEALRAAVFPLRAVVFIDAALVTYYLDYSAGLIRRSAFRGYVRFSSFAVFYGIPFLVSLGVCTAVSLCADFVFSGEGVSDALSIAVWFVELVFFAGAGFVFFSNPPGETVFSAGLNPLLWVVLQFYVFSGIDSAAVRVPVWALVLAGLFVLRSRRFHEQ